MSEEKAAELTAVQAALAAEHAAVYGYGVVGGRIREGRRQEAKTAYDAHRARRDALVREVRDLGGTPVAASAGYALPFPVPDSAAAVQLAAELEDRVAGVYPTSYGRRRAGCAVRPRRRCAKRRSGRCAGAAGAYPSLVSPSGPRHPRPRRHPRRDPHGDAGRQYRRKGTTRAWLSNRRSVW